MDGGCSRTAKRGFVKLGLLCLRGPMKKLALSTGEGREGREGVGN